MTRTDRNAPKRVILTLGVTMLLGLSVSGCANPIVLQDPETGEMAQCASDNRIGLIYKWSNENCAEQYETAGWVRMK